MSSYVLMPLGFFRFFDWRVFLERFVILLCFYTAFLSFRVFYWISLLVLSISRLPAVVTGVSFS